MKKTKQTREQLEKRRDEINAQLNRVNADERIELERDLEDQAINSSAHLKLKYKLRLWNSFGFYGVQKIN